MEEFTSGGFPKLIGEKQYRTTRQFKFSLNANLDVHTSNSKKKLTAK